MKAYIEVEVEVTGRLTKYRAETRESPEEPRELEDVQMMICPVDCDVELWFVTGERIRLCEDHPMWEELCEDLYLHLLEQEEEDLLNEGDYRYEQMKDKRDD